MGFGRQSNTWAGFSVRTLIYPRQYHSISAPNNTSSATEAIQSQQLTTNLNKPLLRFLVVCLSHFYFFHLLSLLKLFRCVVHSLFCRTYPQFSISVKSRINWTAVILSEVRILVEYFRLHCYVLCGTGSVIVPWKHLAKTRYYAIVDVFSSWTITT